MSVNLVGRRLMAHYKNEYVICGDVIASRVVDEDNSLHTVVLVQPLNTGDEILDTVIVEESEIIQAWFPDCMEV